MVLSGFLWLLCKPFKSIGEAIRGGKKVAEQPLTSSSQDPGASAAASSSIRSHNLGVSPDGCSYVYLVRGSSPEDNMAKLLEMLGGIEKFISKDDIILLKVNAQWWNQGMTNTDAIKAFIEAVLEIPGFKGEVIIADNHQCAVPNSRAWTTRQRNGAFNYNELVEYFHANGHPNVTKYHWCCAGPNPRPLQGDASQGSRIIEGPWDGDGYVWRHDLLYTSPLGRKCMLTYPIFTSSYSGTTIDFKEGAWRNGGYTGQSVKFINFSALNHHGPYVGVTASVKNYMGIVDMTCGFQGTTPEGYWNTHYVGIRDLTVPLSKYLPWRIQNAANQYNWKYFCHAGAVLGMFMREVRMADLNIITAHWVGYESRTRTDLSGYPRALLAGIDPVALDYVACQKILEPLTKGKSKKQSLRRLHDASDRSGPFYKFLDACHKEEIGNIDPKAFKVKWD